MDTTPIEGDDLTAARAREAALREVLEVISRSRDDDGPVFRSILSKAAGLCDAPMARLHLVDEDRKSFRVAAFWGDAPRAMTEGENWPLDPEFTLSRTLIDGETLHMEDHAKSGNYLRGDPVAVRIVEEEGIRTRLSVPLLRGTTPIGSITLSRRVVKPFTPDQIALVETFAAQAVIAIENVRQFRELQTRLEREAASKEILRVISESRDDEKPVFDVILRSAQRLCKAPMAMLSLADEDRSQVRIPAHRGTRPEFSKILETVSYPIERTDYIAVRSVVDPQVYRLDDIADTDLYRSGDPRRVEMVDVEGIRSMLNVPLFSDGKGIGGIALYRREVDPFSDDDVAVARNFAAQAVIAIENVRQFRELQMRLEREKASAEILEVISQSRDNEQPVFDVILENAARLCGSPQARLHIVNGAGSHFRLAAAWGESLSTFDVGEEFPIDRPQIIPTAIRETRTIHIEDIANDQLYAQGDPIRRRLVDVEGIRTYLTVPLVSGDRAFGSITLSRREVRPFAEAEIALVETFAAQAVIAIENVRQFRELQTRLEREKASRETLQVISRSRDDDMPVFDTILENACRLCNAPLAYLSMVTEDGAHVVSPARRGAFESFGVTLDKLCVPLAGSRLALARSIAECRVIRMDDIADDDVYRSGDPNRVSMVEDEGARSLLVVPLVSDGAGIGSITLYRREVAPFSDDDVTLVEGFAAQAVIAIENVRQFRELQTRLEREAASREILNIIARSRDDEAPVFEAILDHFMKLCGTPQTFLYLLSEDESRLDLVANKGKGAEEVRRMREKNPMLTSDRDTAFMQVYEQKATLHIENIRDTERYRRSTGDRREAADVTGARTTLLVPLLSGDACIGCLGALRSEVKPYTPDEIALLETFAAQAVIAIENVRQFRELQAQLEREAATREILQVISRSWDDEQPVFEGILRKASQLCGSTFAGLFLGREGDEAQVLAAQLNAHPEIPEIYADGKVPMDPERSLIARAIIEQKVIHQEDMRDTDAYRDDALQVRKMVDDYGLRTNLMVPLLGKDGGLGALGMWKNEVSPFTPDQIALVETFAAQAVIAIENVRQFRELQTRLEREEASREILGVISQSRDDEQPVFDVILENACRLCDTPIGAIVLGHEGGPPQMMVANRGASEASQELYRTGQYTMDPESSIAARAIIECRTIHIEDMVETDGYRQGDSRQRTIVDVAGVRTNMFVPLISQGKGIGCFLLFRREVRPFTHDQIALVETFAAQAVIAIENVRQFRELQARLEREKATGEVLGVISRSRDDDLPVFDTILENAARLCGAPMAALHLVDEARTCLLVAAHWGDPLKHYKPGDMLPLEGDHASARTIRDKQAIHIEDLADTDLYRNRNPIRVQNVEEEGIRTFLAVPLVSGDEAIGNLVVFRRMVKPFTDDEIALVETFAAQAVIAIENVRQFQALEARTEEVQALNASLEDRVEAQVGEIERMGKLKSFLPAAVADAVVSSGSEKMLKSHRALLGILFCDMRGFTAFCETAEPEETIEVLQTYHQEMGKLIAAHGAGVDHRMGDGIMVLFNDPLPCEDPAGEAVRLAMAMREKMVELCRGWKKLGHRLGFGVGVSLGYATVGMVGYEERSEYTASGTAVNLAARLCDHAEDGEILLSPRAAIAVEDDVVCEPGGVLELKGLTAPVEVMKAVAPR